MIVYVLYRILKRTFFLSVSVWPRQLPSKTSKRNGSLRFTTIAPVFHASSSVPRLILGMTQPWSKNLQDRSRDLYRVSRVRDLRESLAPSNMLNARRWHKKAWRMFLMRYVITGLFNVLLTSFLFYPQAIVAALEPPVVKKKGTKGCLIL